MGLSGPANAQPLTANLNSSGVFSVRQVLSRCRPDFKGIRGFATRVGTRLDACTRRSGQQLPSTRAFLGSLSVPRGARETESGQHSLPNLSSLGNTCCPLDLNLGNTCCPVGNARCPSQRFVHVLQHARPACWHGARWPPHHRRKAVPGSLPRRVRATTLPTSVGLDTAVGNTPFPTRTAAMSYFMTVGNIRCCLESG
jgi:hypothetical protein